MLIRATTRSLNTLPEIIIFDGPNGAADRRALLPQYKPPVAGDEKVFADLPRIHDGLDLLGIHWIENGQWEALNTQRRADRRRIHPAEVCDKHGVLPHQWCDY